MSRKAKQVAKGFLNIASGKSLFQGSSSSSTRRAQLLSYVDPHLRGQPVAFQRTNVIFLFIYIYIYISCVYLLFLNMYLYNLIFNFKDDNEDDDEDVEAEDQRDVDEDVDARGQWDDDCNIP